MFQPAQSANLWFFGSAELEGCDDERLNGFWTEYEAFAGMRETMNRLSKCVKTRNVVVNLKKN